MSIYDVHDAAKMIAAGLVSGESEDRGYYSVNDNGIDMLVGISYRMADALETEKQRRKRQEEDFENRQNEMELDG